MKTFSHYISLHPLFSGAPPFEASIRRAREIYDEMIDWLDERDVEYLSSIYSFLMDSEDAIAFSLRFNMRSVRIKVYD